MRALAAAGTLAVLMLVAGNAIFASLGITVDDLRVGGGLILLTISITDLAFGELKKRRGGGKDERKRFEDAGPVDLPVVPLGIPLIIGPGAITTVLIASGQYGGPVTAVSILLNLSLVFVAFHVRPAAAQGVRARRVEGRGEGGEPVPGRHRRRDDQGRRDRDGRRGAVEPAGSASSQRKTEDGKGRRERSSVLTPRRGGRGRAARRRARWCPR